MKGESVRRTSYVLLTDDNGEPFGVEINGGENNAAEGGKTFCIGDTVEVIGDGGGYISPSIIKPGVGKIEEIRTDTVAPSFGVRMRDSGQFGHVSHARMERV